MSNDTPIRKPRPHHDDLWYDRRMDESLNRWFASYDEAVTSQKEYGGYLLPFRHQFVVVDTAAIKALGLDPEDPDWKAIDLNLVHPADEKAFLRLRKKREDVRNKQHEQ